MAPDPHPLQMRVVRALTPADRGAVLQFLADAREREGRQLDDHLVADLRSPRDGFAAAIVERSTPEGGQYVLGYAQATSANDGSIVDALVATNCPGDHDEQRLRLLAAVIDQLPTGEQVTWWAHNPQHDLALATTLGMSAHRALLQMRRPLPLEPTHLAGGLAPTRPFQPGHDEAAWLEVNNAAFRWHGEQGGWDLPTLQQRQHEPWFSPAGFLLHEHDGQLVAFCWTKLHPSGVGEIYVIAVHPSAHGRGLGKALTVAGLHHLASVGATEAMLYVDAENHGAVRLYEHLGFHTAQIDQAFRREASVNA